MLRSGSQRGGWLMRQAAGSSRTGAARWRSKDAGGMQMKVQGCSGEWGDVPFDAKYVWKAELPPCRRYQPAAKTPCCRRASPTPITTAPTGAPTPITDPPRAAAAMEQHRRGRRVGPPHRPVGQALARATGDSPPSASVPVASSTRSAQQTTPASQRRGRPNRRCTRFPCLCLSCPQGKDTA